MSPYEKVRHVCVHGVMSNHLIYKVFVPPTAPACGKQNISYGWGGESIEMYNTYPCIQVLSSKNWFQELSAAWCREHWVPTRRRTTHFRVLSFSTGNLQVPMAKTRGFFWRGVYRVPVFLVSFKKCSLQEYTQDLYFKRQWLFLGVGLFRAKKRKMWYTTYWPDIQPRCMCVLGVQNFYFYIFIIFITLKPRLKVKPIFIILVNRLRCCVINHKKLFQFCSGFFFEREKTVFVNNLTMELFRVGVGDGQIPIVLETEVKVI